MSAASESRRVTLPDIELLSELGSGAFSIVYRGRHSMGDVAVKVYRLDRDVESAARRFAREAAILARFDHPGLQRVFDVGQVEDRPYIVREFIDGETMARMLNRGPLDREVLVSTALGLAEVLAVVHDHGLTHRDVKPSNILLDRNGQPHLIDFDFVGYGQRHEDNENAIGTVQYTAPEQSGMLNRIVDGRSDLYSLGVVLFEAATGRLPFEGEDAATLVHKHASVPAPSVSTLRPDLGSGIAAIIGKLLAKDPDDRYQTGWQLIADLERLDELDRASRPSSQLGRGARRPPHRRSPPFVGRAQELQRLKNIHDRTLSGGTHTVVVAGEAGIGRTRLLSMFCGHVRNCEGILLHAACSPENPVPFSALRGALGEFAQTLRAKGASPAGKATLRNLVDEQGPWLRRFAPALVAAVGATTSMRPEPAQAGFRRRVLDFLTGLARVDGRLAIVIDDAQWLDDETRSLLQELAAGARVPVLVVFAVRTDDQDPMAAARFVKDFGGMNCEQIELEPLHASAIGELIRFELRGLDVPRDLLDTIALRCGGNPLALREHALAMIHAGLLRPSWGQWRMESADLDRLVLHSDVKDLLVRRLDRLSDECQDFLQTAALIGSTFEFEIVDLAHDRPTSLDLLEEALSNQIIERMGHGEFRFIHESMRTALLDRLAPDDRVRRHGAIADALRTDDLGRPDRLYALAHHAYAALDEHTIHRTFRACVAAAKAALADRATPLAKTLVARALEVASKGGLTVAADVHVTAAAIAIAAGSVASGEEHARQALHATTDPVDRAHVHAYLAEAHLINFHAETAWNQVASGLDELRARRSTVIGRIGTVAASAIQLWFKRILRRPPTVAGDASGQRRLRVVARLYELGGFSAYIGMQPLRLAELGFMAVANAERLGASPELARAYAGYGVILAAVHREGTAHYYLRQAIAVAKSLNNPALSAHCDMYHSTALHLLGSVLESERLSMRCLIDNERKIDAMDYYNGAADLAFNLFVRGYFQEAWEWIDRGSQRMEANDKSEFVYAPLFDVSAFSMLGRPGDAARGLERSLTVLSQIPTDRFRWSILLAHRLFYHIEQEELAEPIDDTIAVFADLGISPLRSIVYTRIYFVAQVYARIAQYRAETTPARTAKRLQQLEQAVAELEAAAQFTPFVGHLCVGQAALALYSGDVSAAHYWLAKAQDASDALDSPWVTFEVEWLRAEILDMAGNSTGAQQHARIAHGVAAQFGWIPRARRARTRFDLDFARHRNGLTQGTDSGPARDLKLRRQLDALLGISVASATVLDSQAYAGSVLGEVVRILGAERSFLLLLDEETGEPRLVAGRDAHGESLLLDQSYSASVVRQVIETRAAVVSDGKAHATTTSQSTFSGRDLRSIIAAPLMLRDEIRGVIYLDSRLARGLFTQDDTEILQGIANHIATALETARTARIEANFEAERQQRELAEAMRALAHRLSSTLQLEEVVEGLLRHVHTIVPYEAGGVALLEADELLLYDTFEHAGAAPITAQTMSSLFERVSRGDEALVVTAAELEPIDPVVLEGHSWLAIPLTRHGQSMGLLTLRSPPSNTFSAREREVASALAGQAVTAIQNARLFDEVQRLATTDGLTGAFNRRHLFDRALQEFDRSRRYHRPLSVIILDLDHFKQVNDKHGHAVGDRLLRAVADVCLRTVRACDVLGRYGGEEFVVVLPDTGLEEAAALAERMRVRLAMLELGTGHEAISVTGSLGITEICDADEDFDTMLDRSDRALYAAKSAGRDAVFVSAPNTPPQQWHPPRGTDALGDPVGDRRIVSA